MSYPMCYTVRVMKMKTKDKITFIPPLKQDEHGWLNINKEIVRITSIHHFDDGGAEMETLTLEDGREVYTFDEGTTFTTELYEG